MERVLEGAVEHGATMMRDRLQAVVPPAQAQLLIQENAHVRGFRLDGYGVFFDVDRAVARRLADVEPADARSERSRPPERARRVLKTRINPTDIDMQQALKRIELQVGPHGHARRADRPAPPQPDARNVTGSAAGLADQLAGAAAAAAPPPACGRQPPIRSSTIPNEAYRAEVIQALIDAMLDHSSPLGIGPNEWLTIAARRNEERPRLAPADSGAQSVVIRVSGADLAAFRAGQMSREEVVKRVDRRVLARVFGRAFN